jgi:hypothetical protein
MPIVQAVLARVLVDDIDGALPLYEKLSGTNDVKRSAFETSSWRGWVTSCSWRDRPSPWSATSG